MIHLLFLRSFQLVLGDFSSSVNLYLIRIDLAAVLNEAVAQKLWTCGALFAACQDDCVQAVRLNCSDLIWITFI